MMAEIGKRVTRICCMVAFAYLSILPTVKKKLTVMVDWTIDFLFKADVAMIKRTDLTIDY
jgi:hypothetical protein